MFWDCFPSEHPYSTLTFSHSFPPPFLTLHYTYWLTSHSPWTNHSAHHALYNCVPRCS
jgi:hypothetical protein